MMRVFYLDLFAEDPEWYPQAQELSSKVYEFSEFLVKVLQVEDIGVRYPGVATYHPSCHLLRELEVREEPLKLLGSVSSYSSPTCRRRSLAADSAAPSRSSSLTSLKEWRRKGEQPTVYRRRYPGFLRYGLLDADRGMLSRQGSDIKVRHLAQLLDGEAS